MLAVPLMQLEASEADEETHSCDRRLALLGRAGL